MKVTLVALTVLSMFTAAVLPAFSGGPTWHNSQRRMKKAHLKRLQQEAKFWKEFDSEMAQVEKALDFKKRERPRSKKKAIRK